MQQVMTFRLGEESYGLEIAKVSEIVEHTLLTLVPRAPSWVEGILNHHGRIVMVMNLSSFFELPAGTDALKRIAVLDSSSGDIGFLLNDPIEVVSEWETAGESAASGEFSKGKFIGRMLVSGGRVINLIDVERLAASLDEYFR